MLIERTEDGLVLGVILIGRALVNLALQQGNPGTLAIGLREMVV